MTGIPHPELFAPPPDPGASFRRRNQQLTHIGARLFPEWFIVQRGGREDEVKNGSSNRASRRLVHLDELENGLFEKQPVVATRFVRACTKGHVDDLDWRGFVHKDPSECNTRPLWLDELGQTGDLGDLVVRCDCGARRRLSDALGWQKKVLGECRGRRPWLGKYASVDCDELNRLLIRTASNAYFSQVLRVLSIPESDSNLREDVDAHWSILQAVQTLDMLEQFGPIPDVKKLREVHGDAKLFHAIQSKRSGPGTDLPTKDVELAAFLNAPEGYGDDIPVNPNYHARRLPERRWKRSALSDGIEAVVQLHRLREVSALVGFTRLEAALPDIDGEYETDVTRADLDENPRWFPAVENRGEGIFISLRPEAVTRWLARPSVKKRVAELEQGHARWSERREGKCPPFPGGAYILLHSTAHLLMQALALSCGYPSTSIRERIYLDSSQNGCGFLLYTASPDADGTLGGLVQQALHIEDHLARALSSGELCSSDPICAQHSPITSLDERWLHGAACHSCSLIAETSCEMRNEYLDRSLVVPTVDERDAAFFERPA